MTSKIKLGRPSTYTKLLGMKICDCISNGESLREICRRPGMPSWRTVYRWMESDENFSTRIAQARARGYDAIAAECLTIADTPMEGVEKTTKDDGRIEEKRGDMLGHRKLQIETRLKLLAKWDPKRYGDRLELAADVMVKKSAADFSDAELLAIAMGTHAKT